MEIETIEKRPVSATEVKETLTKMQKDKKELNFRAAKVLDYTNEIVTNKQKDVDETFNKIKDLNIPRLNDRHIIKIIDIAPEDIDTLKATLSGEEVTLKVEDLERLVKAIK